MNIFQHRTGQQGTHRQNYMSWHDIVIYIIKHRPHPSYNTLDSNRRHFKHPSIQEESSMTNKSSSWKWLHLIFQYIYPRFIFMYYIFCRECRYITHWSLSLVFCRFRTGVHNIVKKEDFTHDQRNNN